MRVFLLLLVLCVPAISVLGQKNECYESLLQKGKDQFNTRHFNKAIVKWRDAFDCPNLTSAQMQALNGWVAKAQNALPPPSVSKAFTRQSYEPETVFVQGGAFQMGSNDIGSDEKPVHTALVSNYYIGKYEVTQQQWREVMGTSPSYFKNCDDCPVEQVSYDDVKDYLTILSAKTGRKYRLPTEAEWEFAARGGNASKGCTYSGTSDATQLYRYANFCDKNCTQSWADQKQDDGYANTAPVGKFLPNELGLFDMSGNVREWCSDWRGAYQSATVTNPTGSASGTYRVLRGGSWYGYDFNCHVAARLNLYPTFRNLYVGLRVVRYN